MKYYFDVTETFIKTVAVEAKSVREAKKIVEKAWHENLVNINHQHPDDIKFKNAQKDVQLSIDEGFVNESELLTFDDSVLSVSPAPRINHIKIDSEKIYSAQGYLELVTGNCYVVRGDDDAAFIEKTLDNLGYSLWNYPVNEADHIAENELAVVLVDCLVYNNEHHEYEHVFRWFEIEPHSETNENEGEI